MAKMKYPVYATAHQQGATKIFSFTKVSGVSAPFWPRVSFPPKIIQRQRITIVSLDSKLGKHARRDE